MIVSEMICTSAPIHWFVSQKTSYLRQLFILSSNIPKVPWWYWLPSALNRILFINDNRDLTLYSTWTFIPSLDQIFWRKMVRADYFSWNFGPPDYFFRRTKISATVPVVSRLIYVVMNQSLKLWVSCVQWVSCTQHCVSCKIMLLG